MEFVDPDTGRTYCEKRRVRFENVSHARELTFSCYHRFRFLDRDRTRNWFVEALRDAQREHPFDLWAYVVMPEHVHLLIYPRVALSRAGVRDEPPASPRVDDSERATLLNEQYLAVGQFLRGLKEPVARKAIAYLKNHAPEWIPRITVREGKRIRHRFWQPGGGYDRNIVEPATLRHVIAYIHANPVRRGLVEKPEDWEWSSARWYAGIRPVAIHMDELIFEILGGTP